MSKHLNQNSQHSSKEYYRNHVLNFIEKDDICIGEVFQHDHRFAYCESVDVDSARQYCRQIIDERLFEKSTENRQHSPTLEQVIQALQSTQEQFDMPCRNLLKRHIAAQNTPIDIDALRACSGLHSTTEVFLKYAELARLICDALAYLPTSSASYQDPYLNMIINDTAHDPSASTGSSISLKPLIFEALCHIS